MRKTRFTEHQIISILKSVETGISEASKAKYGGMEASDINKMRNQEDENRHLKQIFAVFSLGCGALKDVINECTQGL